MRAPYTQLYAHLVWSTWDRLPLITPEIETPVYRAIQAKCDELKSPLQAVGGMPDHVHLLVQVHPTVAVADLVKEIKGASSHLITHVLSPAEFFKWQGAYGAFTIAKADIPAVQAYIFRQKEHHRTGKLWESEPGE